MPQLCERGGLPPKPAPCVFVFCHPRMQELDGDDTVESKVLRTKHLACPAAANRGLEAVAPTEIGHRPALRGFGAGTVILRQDP